EREAEPAAVDLEAFPTAAGFVLTRRWRKADSNRRSLPVNELVSQAGMRKQAGRYGWSRTRRPRSGDQGFESAFLQRGVWCEPNGILEFASGGYDGARSTPEMDADALRPPPESTDSLAER